MDNIVPLGIALAIFLLGGYVHVRRVNHRNRIIGNRLQHVVRHGERRQGSFQKLPEPHNWGSLLFVGMLITLIIIAIYASDQPVITYHSMLIR